ncbi:hypothetical protein Q3G72_016927 [Acer saccharum]|nr:hypothetical protein Q3G72_016927 [Acer saccharum]
MMTGYCKEGMLDNATVVFEGLQCKDLVSFNAMISGYAQNGVGGEALRLYSNMHKIGLQADDATLVSVFTACSSLESLKKRRPRPCFCYKEWIDKECICL